MSLRVDGTLLAGALVVGDRGHGVLAENIPSTGSHGPGYAYNDLALPADNGKEIRGLVTVPPSGPNVTSFFAYEDTSFDLEVSADGTYQWTYELFVDGVSQGTAVATVSIGTGQTAEITEGVTAGSTLSGVTAASVNIAEGASAGSAVTGIASAVAALVSGTVAGESWAALADATAALAEGAVAGESISTGSQFFGAVTEGAEAADLWVGARLVIAAIESGTTAGSAFAAAAQAAAGISEGVTASDIAAAVAQAVAALSEQVDLDDATTASVTIFGAAGALYAEVRLTPAVSTTVRITPPKCGSEAN